MVSGRRLADWNTQPAARALWSSLATVQTVRELSPLTRVSERNCICKQEGSGITGSLLTGYHLDRNPRHFVPGAFLLSSWALPDNRPAWGLTASLLWQGTRPSDPFPFHEMYGHALQKSHNPSRIFPFTILTNSYAPFLRGNYFQLFLLEQ